MALPDVVFHKDAALGPEALRCFRRGMKPESSGGVAARRPRKGRNSTPDDMSATPDPSHFLPVERTRQTLMKARAFAAPRYCRQ